MRRAAPIANVVRWLFQLSRLSCLMSLAAASLPVREASAQVPTTQVSPEQHPPGHEEPSQTQFPFWHRAPSAQAGPLPQRHTPAVEHRSD